MSHWEVMFLRAEAAARFGTADSEKGMFDNAVTAHFNYIADTLDAGAYLSANVIYDESADLDSKLNMIGVQKWISMCGLQETEGWIEARRFDLPNSRIFTDPLTLSVALFVCNCNTSLASKIIIPSFNLADKDAAIDFAARGITVKLSDASFILTKQLTAEESMLKACMFCIMAVALDGHV